MKQLLLVGYFSFFFGCAFCIGQEPEEIEVSTLRAPSSPASKILGNEPNDITRPKSWNELEVSLFTDFLTDDGAINLNRLINLEVSPYWLKKDRKLSTEEFIYQDDPLENIQQNFSISLATSNNLIIPDSIGQKNTSLAIGLRTMLWKGTKLEKETLESRYTALREDLKFTTRLLPILMNITCVDCTREDYVERFIESIKKNRNNVFSNSLSEREKFETIENIKQHLLENLENTSADGSSYQNYIEELSENKYFSNLKENLVTVQEMMADRKGFKLEVAAAFAIDFPTNQTNFSVVPQYSFWITPSFQPYKTEWIEFLGIIKYQGFHLDYYQSILPQNEYRDSAFDIGLKLVLKANKFSFEFEGLTRSESTIATQNNIDFNKQKSSDSKYVARINYRLSNNLVLAYDFGKDFTLVGVDDTNLISQFALNYAIGAITKKETGYGN